MKCKRCEDFYEKYPLKKDEDGELVHCLEYDVVSSPIKCAFENETFSSDNWCCQTMKELRKYVEDNAIWSQDHNIGVIQCLVNCGGKDFWSHLVMHWYKNRGRTDEALLFGGDSPRPLTLDIANKLLGDYSKLSIQ